ncbi:TonB-dependent receptor [Xanthobacter dioxanivorans]|uniref:TonB-dependent receptor n=1 Tax=Xanthobacter dioxanivorans TaxID=2528964 RepID=A0A974PT88_9HYPH|nr:TonB-dependent receptor [Xanthobacter dioxanivorans]QRG09372.1 TonB-dependent receptor [Xanthobacter dioxanivorans]
MFCSTPVRPSAFRAVSAASWGASHRAIVAALAGVSLAGAAFAAPAVAQEESQVTLDTITVTAARADRPISDVPQTVRVIDQAEIQEQLELTNNAAAVLAKLIPGYSPSTQTISGASENFRGRDLLVMIDGVPQNTPLRNVSRLLALVDLNAVERIEVVAGASSLYGSGATGGTVNFIMKKPQDGKPTVSVNTALRFFTADPGNSLAPEVSATVTGGQNGFDYLFTGTGTFADRTYDGAGNELPSDGMLGQGGGDRFGRGNFFAKLGYNFDPTKRFEVSANWVYLQQNPQWMTTYALPYARPDFGNFYTGQPVLEDTKSYAAKYTDTAFALGNLTLLAYYNDVKKRFNYSAFDIDYNGAVYYSGNLGHPTSLFNQSELYSERTGLNLTIDTPVSFYEGATFTWGADVGHDKTWQTLTNGQEIFTPLTQVNYAGFGQLQVPIGDRLVVRAGARYELLDLTVDDFIRPAVFVGFSGLGYAVLPDLPVTGGEYQYSAPTFNLGATYKLTETSELYGGFSQGFALPDIGAFTRRAGASGAAQILYYGCYLGAGPLPPVNYTCPKQRTLSYDDLGIEAQIVNNYELGIRGSIGAFRGSLAGFVSTSEEGTNFIASTNQVSQQKEMIYGVEATAEYQFTAQFKMGANGTFREGRWDSDGDGELDAFLPNNRIATPVRGTLWGEYRFEVGTVLRLEAEAWSGRDVFDGTGIYEIQSGYTFNAAISHPFGGGQAYASVSNLLDADYENPSATATRNLPVNAWGRTVTIGYRTTF